MPLSGFQFGKQAGPTPGVTPRPSLSPFKATPIPNLPRKPGGMMSPVPIPNATRGSSARITNL